MSDLNFDIVTSCTFSFKLMKYIMHIFAPTESVLNTDHEVCLSYLVGQSFVCFKYHCVYIKRVS